MIGFFLISIMISFLNCSWFENFQWEKLEDRTLTAPLKRPIRNNTDLSNFDEYPRDADEPADDMTGWDAYF